MPVRVFLLDDQEVVRVGIRLFIEADGDLKVVGEASTVAEAIARIPLSQPNVAVLDVKLPDGSGVEVCREVRSRWPEVECIMLTSYSDDQTLFAAIMAGAAGYVLKDIKGRELADAIRRVAEGESLLDPVSTKRLLDRIRGGTPRDERLESLSKQERRVLELIAEGKTNRQIGEEMYLSEKTIKNYVSNLLGKLGLDRRTEAAVYATRLEQKPSADQI